MNGAFATGAVLTAIGVAGYVAGVVAPYQGRAFSITAIMTGVTLLAIGEGGSK